MKNEKAKNINMFDADINSVFDEYYDEEEKDDVEEAQYLWQSKYDDLLLVLNPLRERISEMRRNAISPRAIEEYDRIIDEISMTIGDLNDYEKEELDEAHIQQLIAAKKRNAHNKELKSLTDERQRYLDAIQESETLIAKLKEKNADPSIIDDEQALIDKNKSCIEELDQQISALCDKPSTNK